MTASRWEAEPPDPHRRAAGSLIRFAGDRDDFTIRAVAGSGRYLICTRPANSTDCSCPRGDASNCTEPVYTIVDLAQGIRGTDNWGGLGYRTDGDIAEAAAMFDSGEAEVSLRHNVALRFPLREISPGLTGPNSSRSSEEAAPCAEELL